MPVAAGVAPNLGCLLGFHRGFELGLEVAAADQIHPGEQQIL